MSRLERVIMVKKYKTKKNLRDVWNDLDKAYECLERAFDTLLQMPGLDGEYKNCN